MVAKWSRTSVLQFQVVRMPPVFILKLLNALDMYYMNVLHE